MRRRTEKQSNATDSDKESSDMTNDFPTSFTMMDSVPHTIPPIVRWMEMTTQVPNDETVVMSLVPDNPNADTVYVKLDLPERVHTAPLDGSRWDRPDNPDVVIDLDNDTVVYADTDAADLVQLIVHDFPFPQSLRKFTTYSDMPYDATMVLLCSLMSEDVEKVTGTKPPTVVVEGNLLLRDRNIFYAVLWLCNIQHLVRARKAAREIENEGSD